MRRPGEYIVMFSEDVTKPEETARSVQAVVAQRVAQQYPLPPGSNSSAGPVMPFSILDASRAEAGPDGYTFPVKTATIKLPEDERSEFVISAVRTEQGVAGVWPNTIYTKFSVVPPPGAPGDAEPFGGCAAPQDLGGLAAQNDLKWDECTKDPTDLVWYGQRCGDSLNQIQWTGVFVAGDDGSPLPGCHMDNSDPSYAPGTAWGDAVLGRCGVAPQHARLPTTICESNAPCLSRQQLSGFAQDTTINGCGFQSSRVVYAGDQCGNNLVDWSSFQLVRSNGRLGCKQSPKGSVNPMFDRSWFGSCGVPPANFPACSPAARAPCPCGPRPSSSPSPRPTWPAPLLPW